MADTTTKQGMKTKYKVMIAVLAVLVVACGALSVYFYQKSLALPEPASLSSAEEELERDPNMLKGQLQGKSQEEIQAELDKRVAENMFSISINTEPVFEDGNSEGNLRIENSQANHYLMVVEILLDGEEEPVYKSGAIDPGYCVETGKLNRDLPKGEYSGTAYFKAYNPDSSVLVGQAAAEVILKVLN